MQASRQPQPKHIARHDLTEPDNTCRIRMDMTLCHLWAANYPEAPICPPRPARTAGDVRRRRPGATA